MSAFSRPSAQALPSALSSLLQRSGAVTVRTLVARFGEPESVVDGILDDLVRDGKVEVIRTIEGVRESPDYYRWIQPGDGACSWQRNLLRGCAGVSPLRLEKRLAVLAER